MIVLWQQMDVYYMIVKLFANYGVLAHEHTPQYNYNSNGVSDAVSVTVPDKYSPAERLLYGVPYGYSVTHSTRTPHSGAPVRLLRISAKMANYIKPRPRGGAFLLPCIC